MNSVVSTSPYIYVSGGFNSNPYISPGAASAGMVRYHNQELQVYDGISWLTLSQPQATIGLSGEAESAIKWAAQKAAEEKELKILMEKHPGLKAAYEQFELMRILVTEENKEKT